MEEYSIKNLREQVAKEMQEERAKLRKAYAESTTPSKALPILTREEMVPYKHMQNLAELPLGSTFNVMAIGYNDRYTDKKNLF